MQLAGKSKRNYAANTRGFVKQTCCRHPPPVDSSGARFWTSAEVDGTMLLGHSSAEFPAELRCTPPASGWQHEPPGPGRVCIAVQPMSVVE